MGILKDLKQRCHILVQLPSSSQWLLELSHFCAFMFVVLGGDVFITGKHRSYWYLWFSLCFFLGGVFFPLKVSGYPGSHGIPAMAGSIYPGQASLLDQADSWNHRPQEISVWQPNMEVWWSDKSVTVFCILKYTFLYYKLYYFCSLGRSVLGKLSCSGAF